MDSLFLEKLMCPKTESSVEREVHALLSDVKVGQGKDYAKPE